MTRAQGILGRVALGMLLAAAIGAAPAHAASKEIIELQTQVQQLLDMMQRLQSTVDARFGAMQHLVEQAADNTSQMAQTVTAMQQKINAQAENTSGKLDKTIQDLQTQLQNIQNPPSGTTQGPGGASPAPGGAMNGAPMQQAPANQAPPLKETFQ